jgi:hypothetical protein
MENLRFIPNDAILVKDLPQMTVPCLKKCEAPVAIVDNDEIIGVIIPWEIYLEMRRLASITVTMEN